MLINMAIISVEPLQWVWILSWYFLCWTACSLKKENRVIRWCLAKSQRVQTYLGPKAETGPIWARGFLWAVRSTKVYYTTQLTTSSSIWQDNGIRTLWFKPWTGIWERKSQFYTCCKFPKSGVGNIQAVYSLRIHWIWPMKPKNLACACAHTRPRKQGAAVGLVS